MEASLDRASNRLRSDYVDDAQVGSIIAFYLPDSSVKSARIVKKSTRERKFLVRTKYGSKFLISFDDVVWVKITDWWPKWVYNLLKGIEESDGAEN